MDATAQHPANATPDQTPSESARAEHRIQTIIDTIPVLAWRARADGSAEFFNQRWRDYAGMSLEEARDWGWTVALHPDDIEPVSEQWRAIVASAQPGELEARLRRSDGVYRWFLFRVAPSLDDQGRVVNWYGTNTDIEDRKRDEDALRAGEENLRLIVDSVPGMVCTMSAAGEVEFVNRRILAYMGLTLEELKDWPAALHADDRARSLDLWTRSIRSGQPYDSEHRIRGADGGYRWFHTRGIALRDADGRIARWYIAVADIDDRKRAEDTLKESERTLRVLFESIPGMITVHGATGDLEYVNQRLLDFLGTEFTALRDAENGWANVVHPDDFSALDNAWLRSLELGQPMDVTFRMRRADGAFRWCHSRKQPLFDDQGQIIRWYSLVWDIEERRRAEVALEASERELRLLVDSFPGMITVASADGRHEYANRRVMDYVGKSVAEVANLGWLDDIHPDEREMVRKEWLRCVATGEPMDLKHRWRRFDGVYRWFHVRVEPLLDEHGKIRRWYGLLIDVDDRKNAEEALRSSQAELAHVTRVTTMGELTASIAHEVNQPLSAVVNNAGACLGLLPDTAHFQDIRGALNDIVDDANRASSIIARVRQLAKRAPFESTLLDLRDIVSDVLALARHESVTRRVIIRTELSADLPLVVGDRVQLQQVLLNLVVNGMDAMSAVEESERVLTIRAHCEARGRTRDAVVSVQDAGVGFRRKEMERLFEAFYTTKPHGLGMGLTISRSIIAAHGGRLWAEPNQDPGATLAFSLPGADSRRTDRSD